MKILERKKVVSGVVLLATGEYIISDPCYQVPDEHWHELLGSCDHFLSDFIGSYKNGRQLVYVVSFHTAYGDGTYYDQDHTEYGVDSGMIGIMLVKDLPKIDAESSRVVRFDVPFRCYEKDGVIHFGHITINTDPKRRRGLTVIEPEGKEE